MLYLRKLALNNALNVGFFMRWALGVVCSARSKASTPYVNAPFRAVWTAPTFVDLPAAVNTGRTQSAVQHTSSGRPYQSTERMKRTMHAMFCDGERTPEGRLSS